MKNLPSPKVAERNQQRKLQYVPSVWWLVVVAAVIAGFVYLVHR